VVVHDLTVARRPFLAGTRSPSHNAAPLATKTNPTRAMTIAMRPNLGQRMADHLVSGTGYHGSIGKIPAAGRTTIGAGTRPKVARTAGTVDARAGAGWPACDAAAS